MRKSTQSTRKNKTSLRETIAREYLGGYRQYVKHLKNIGVEPVLFEEWAKFYSMSVVRRGE